MTNTNKLFCSLLAVAMMSLGSATFASEESQANVEKQAGVKKQANVKKSPKSDPMQFARGAKAWAKTCARCHNMKSAKDNSDEIWKTSVSHMRVRANIPGNVARDIEAFLRASNNKK